MLNSMKNILNHKWGRSAAIFVGASLMVMLIARAYAKPNILTLTPQRITIKSDKLVFDQNAPEKKQFGKLTWRGGLFVTSQSPYFGGFSGLTIAPDGKQILAVSDAGFWMIADLKHEGRMLNDVGTTKIGPLVTPGKGGKFKRSHIDAEGVALKGDKIVGGTALISFERYQRMDPYAIGADALTLKPGRIVIPGAQRKWKKNKGIEAIDIIRSGPLKDTIVAIAERRKDKNGNLKGWLIKGKKKIKSFTIKRYGGFDITGLAALPDGDLLLLERRFRVEEGVKMRIRRLDRRTIKPGALITGETLIESHNIHHQIDNMEGIAAHRAKNGEIVITLISDDNFNFFQRTLILQFGLRDKPERRASNK